MSTAFAQIPLQTATIDSPVSNEEQATLETTRVLFFAHDTITDIEKRELPFKEFGGIFLPHIATLRDANHMLYRCQLTQLPAFKMIAEWDTMLPPEDRKHWQKSFTQTVTDPVTHQSKNVLVNGFLGSDLRHIRETGEFKQRRDNTVIFNKRYPLYDAREAIKRSGTHTPGGVIEIIALMGASAEDVAEAQYFFFPQWDAIRMGAEQLPGTIKGMQDHLNARVAQIGLQLWDDVRKATYHSIGRDMLRSCSEFNRTVLEAIRSDEIKSKQAFTAGNTDAIPSVISEKYLEQTGTRRKEDAITGQSDSVGELAREMRSERAAKAETEAKMLLLEERKQYTAEVTAGLRERDTDEEIRLGMRKAEAAIPLVPAPITTISTQTPMTAGLVAIEPPIEVAATITASPAVCGAPTASGTCKRELKDNEMACFQHKSE